MGRDIYEKLIKGYTEKQWGRDCKDLPAFIIKRLPVRLTFDNNYFNALYQGIPIGGYTKIIANLLDDIEVRLNTDLENKDTLDALADKVVCTGQIDAYFEYKLGTLESRSVHFEHELLDKPSFQVTPLLTTLIVRSLGLELSSISGLSAVKMKTAMTCLRLTSVVSTVVNGNLGKNILPS